MSFNISLSNQRALVTGASSGLGPFIARSLDSAGASVVLHYHQNEAGARTLAASLENHSNCIQADLTDAGSTAQLFSKAAEEGPVSILVNCAAVESQQVSDLADLDQARWNTTLQANLGAPFLLSRLFAAQGLAGSIINISSIEGNRPAQGHAHYATSKAALEMLTRAAALEFGPADIRVNAVAPGLIWREGIEEGWPEGVAAWRSAAPLQKLVRPEDVAAAVVFLASDAAAAISGTVLTIDAGLSVRPGW